MKRIIILLFFVLILDSGCFPHLFTPLMGLPTDIDIGVSRSKVMKVIEREQYVILSQGTDKIQVRKTYGDTYQSSVQIITFYFKNNKLTEVQTYYSPLTENGPGH